MKEWSDLNFVDHYLAHNSLFESPTSFWKWSAYGAISSVLRDNVYRRMGNGKLYPNIYILILAESSFHRKGAPPAFSQKLVEHVNNTKVISGRASIQAILQEIGRVETSPKTGKIIRGGSATFYAPEMAAALVQDPAAIGILTDIYDPKEKYETLLKTQAKSTIKNLVFSMIAASNEALLRSVYDGTALVGGLLARTFLVAPDEYRKANSLIDLTPEDFLSIEESEVSLKEKLKCISEMNGEVSFSSDAIRVYREWYGPFHASHEQSHDKSGVLGRIHISILKLAIILAASNLSLTVGLDHMLSAIHECLLLVPNYARLSIAGNSKSSIKETGNLILTALVDTKHHSLDRKGIFQKYPLEFDSLTFDSAINNLETAGLVTQVVDGMIVNFKLTPFAIKTMHGIENSNGHKN